MSDIPTTEQSIIAGKLTKSTFRTEQERLEAFAKAMRISAQTGKNGADGEGVAGPQGPAGPPPTPNTITKDITVGDTSLDTGTIQLEDAIVNIIKFAGGAPDFTLTGVNGTTAYFSGAAAAGHKLKITRFDPTT